MSKSNKQKVTIEKTYYLRYRPRGPVSSVELVGSFSSWQPITMIRQDDGSFLAELRLAAGIYEYKFRVDGQWVVVPATGAGMLSTHESGNSVLWVGQHH